MNDHRDLLVSDEKYGPILSQIANCENFKQKYLETRKEESEAENDRHRLIVALSISDFFLFLLRHFKTNHIVQFMYLSQLIVDANGVLVLLKFLNQDFAKIANQDVLITYTVESLLRLMFRTCRNQKERIKANLVQYKATLIMKKLHAKFTTN